MRFDAHIIHVQIKIANLPFTNIQNPFFFSILKVTMSSYNDSQSTVLQKLQLIHYI